MPHPSPVIGMILTPLVLIALMVSAHILQRKNAIDSELSRKLVHIGMGLVALTFPYLFQYTWPVLLLSALSVALMLLLRFIPVLKSSMGGVLNSVKRHSLGEVYFPISIAIIFSITQHNRILYIIPILILTLGDAIAALIGVRYGQFKYKTSDASKSFEGSVTLFTIAFLCTHIPLLLFTHIGRLESLLIGLIIGLLVMEIEAIAWNGLDNIFLPIGAYALLHSFIRLSSQDLSLRLVIAFLCISIVYIIRDKTTLDGGALLGVALLLYISWVLAGWRWIVAPMLVVIAYPLLSPKKGDSHHRAHNIHSVLSVGSVGFIWIFLNTQLNHRDLLYPYMVSYATQLALIVMARWRHYRGERVGRVISSRIAIISCLIIVTSYLLLTGVTYLSIAKSIVVLPFIIFSILSFCRLEQGQGVSATTPLRLRRQALIAGASSFLSALLLLI